MFLATLHKKFGRKQGWKTAAGIALGVSSPTLVRYIKLEETSDADQIPNNIWDALDESRPSVIDSSPYDMVNLFAKGLVDVNHTV